MCVCVCVHGWRERKHLLPKSRCNAACCAQGAWAATQISSTMSGPGTFLMGWGFCKRYSELETSDEQFAMGTVTESFPICLINSLGGGGCGRQEKKEVSN